MAPGNDQEEQGSAPAEERTAAQARSTHASLKGTLSALLALTALLITGYTYYNNQQANQKLAQENHQLAADLHQLKQQQNDAEQQIKAKADDLQSANSALEEKISAFSKQVQTISNQKGTQNQDWRLLKARYYLELAQINAHWSNSFNEQSTAMLLQQADTILTQIKAPELFKIRQTIAQEIQQFKTATTIDVLGLLSQLDAIQGSVAQLNSSTLISPNKSAANKKEAQESTSGFWKKNMQYSLDKLSKLVIIRRNDEEIQTLTSPLFESILKESIRLNIQEAQWAVINSNATAYQFALNQALATLKRGFNEHLSNTAALINQLTALQKINLTQKNPSVGQALPLLNQLIEQKQLSKPINKADEQGEPSL